jgi:hypothetical protein
MGVPINNVTRRVVFAASGTGPYAFTFEILAATDISVYKDDALLTLTTDYTVTINSNGTGSVTLTAAPTGATQIAIVGNRTIQRTTDFVTGGDFFANTLNDELDQQTIFAQQNAEGLARALSAPQTDPTTINMTLPRAALRANKALGFDANGNPTIADTLGTNRGNWAASTLYYVRDIVKDTTNNNIWQCIVQHTSTGSQPINTNTDSAKWTLLVDAAAAATSASNAASSASAAATSASNASTSATNAASSASSASTSASNASTSATNASNSATTASGHASTASTQATNAATSASAASTSATNAASSATAAASSASSASSSASTATTQASNASTSATNAANSATAAASSATTASTQASNASTSATNAANSATSAASSATAAAASYDSFDDRYLGAKTSNPTLDNDGNALLTGALYFNSAANEMRVYTGSAWQALPTLPDLTVEKSFKATAGQTSYTFTGGYRVGFTYVWVNGALLYSDEITATDGSTITFGTALTLNDEVRILTFKAVGSVTAADVGALPTTGGTMTGNITFNGGQTFPGTGDVAGQASSVDNEIALFSGTGGKTIKRATTTGVLKASSGVIAAAVAGTDYVAPGGALGTPSSGNLSNCTADGTNSVGFLNIPQNSQSGAYTLVLGDAGKHILHPSADTTARTFTIPANSSVAFPVGTAITFINQNGAGSVTIAITTDTMRLAGAGTTGSRTLAANGVATAIKITSTEWIISGSGLT